MFYEHIFSAARHYEIELMFHLTMNKIDDKYWYDMMPIVVCSSRFIKLNATFLFGRLMYRFYKFANLIIRMQLSRRTGH